MKILRRSPVVIYFFIFLLCTFIFPYFLFVIGRGGGISDFASVVEFAKYATFPYLMLIWSIYSVYFIKKYSDVLLFVVFILWVLFTSREYYQSDNKLILFVLVVYIFAFVGLFITYISELRMSYHNPMFHRADIVKTKLYPFVVNVNIQEMWVEGTLTSADQGSFFLLFSQPVEIRGEVECKIDYKNRQFFFVADPMTQYDNGIGLRVVPKEEGKKGAHTYKEFYLIYLSHGHSLKFQRFL